MSCSVSGFTPTHPSLLLTRTRVPRVLLEIMTNSKEMWSVLCASVWDIRLKIAPKLSLRKGIRKALMKVLHLKEEGDRQNST